MKSVLDEAMSLSRKRSDAMIARSSDVKAATPSSVISPGRNDTLAYAPPSRARQHAAEQGKYFKGWPYAAIAPIAKRIASREVRVARVAKSPVKHRSKAFLPGGFKGIEGEYGAEVIPGHHLVRAIEDGGAHAIKWSLIYNLVAGIRIWGRGYWWVQRRSKQAVARGEPEWEVCDIPADWIEPIHTDLQPFAAWKVTPPGATTPWIVPADEIVPFHYPDPRDPLNGFSELQAVDQAVVTDDYLQTSQKKSLQSIHPGWIITVGRQPDMTGSGPGMRPVLTQDQRAQLIHEIKAGARGSVRFDEPMIVDGRIESVTKSTNSTIEMGYTESGKILKDRITQIFGTNPAVMGQLENANRAACHDAETELMTRRGWLKYADIREDDVAGTMNPDTGRFEWQAIDKIHVAPNYNGEMVRLKGSKIDVMVTPDHRMWVRRGYQACNKKTHNAPWEFKPASALRCGDTLLLSPKAHVGPRQESFTLPGASYTGPHKRDRCTIPAVIPTTDFLEFFGWWVSEGWTSSYRCKHTGRSYHTVSVRQSVGGETENQQIKRAMKGLGVGSLTTCFRKGKSSSESADGYARQGSNTYTISDKRLWSWLRENGGIGSHAKRLPDFAFDLPSEQLEPMLDAMPLGDGSHHSEKSATYFTVSDELADQTQAAAVMCGRASRIKKTMSNGVRPIAVSSFSTEIGLLPKHISREHYEGAVWCVSVPNGAIITRRNGKTLVAGNSLVADEQFLANTVNPLIEFISQTLTAWLGPLFSEPGERILVYIEPAVAVDAELELKQSLALYDRGLLDGNALLKITMNLPPIPGGNVCFIRPELVPYVIPSDDDPDPDFEANPFVKQFLSRPQPTPSAQKPPNATLGEGQSGGADGGT